MNAIIIDETLTWVLTETDFEVTTSSEILKRIRIELKSITFYINSIFWNAQQIKIKSNFLELHSQTRETVYLIKTVSVKLSYGWPRLSSYKLNCGGQFMSNFLIKEIKTLPETIN